MKIVVILTFMASSACYCQSRNIEKATETFTKEQLIDKYLRNGAWRYYMFSSEWQLCIDSGISINPGIAYFYQQKAMPYFKQGKYEVAMPILDKAVALDEGAYIDYRAFMKCIFSKQYEASIVDFKKAKIVKGENVYVMDHSYDFYIGLSLIQLNRFNEAIPYLKNSINKVLTTSGEKWVHALDYFYLGIAYQELQQHKEAIVYFDKALTNYQNFSDAEYYKVLSLSRSGKYEEASELLKFCDKNFKMGFTINEDNAIYERYPYQISQRYIDMINKK